MLVTTYHTLKCGCVVVCLTAYYNIFSSNIVKNIELCEKHHSRYTKKYDNIEKKNSRINLNYLIELPLAITKRWLENE